MLRMSWIIVVGTTVDKKMGRKKIVQVFRSPFDVINISGRRLISALSDIVSFVKLVFSFGLHDRGI